VTCDNDPLGGISVGKEVWRKTQLQKERAQMQKEGKGRNDKGERAVSRCIGKLLVKNIPELTRRGAGLATRSHENRTLRQMKSRALRRKKKGFLEERPRR